MLTKTQQAIAENRSVYHNRVKSAAVMSKKELAVKHSRNDKLGKKVKRGWLKGYAIKTLTLEERATCPASCVHYKDCFGNNMHLATRYAVDEYLVPQIEFALFQHSAKHPAGFLVRLHILGDFFSVDYVKQWETWLEMFPKMSIYGYTGRIDGDDITKELQRLRDKFGMRFAVRWSGDQTQDFSALSMDDPRTVAKVEARQAFVCPEQTGKTSGCDTCGLCWTSTKPVAFITH